MITPRNDRVKRLCYSKFHSENIVTESQGSPCGYIGSSKMQVHPGLRSKLRPALAPVDAEKSHFHIMLVVGGKNCAPQRRAV